MRFYAGFLTRHKGTREIDPILRAYRPETEPPALRRCPPTA